jgi:coenzyme F420-0:L-glutamate ligase/coenzyme F420-1:gamma-L-glutamate ligase
MDAPRPNPDVTTPARLSVTAPGGIPLISPGDDLVQIILGALDRIGERLADGDILVLAQKIISKSEGRIVDLDTVEPSTRAIEVAEQVDKDPRLVELILSEATEIVRQRKGVLVVAHRCGVVLANAGIDRSNVDQANSDDPAGTNVLLLPEDSDASCARLRQDFQDRAGVTIGIVINDSLGRAWRNGICSTGPCRAPRWGGPTS